MDQLGYLPQLDTFVKWARTLVAQVIGRRQLESQADLSPKFPVKISVLEVNPITYRMPTWSELLDVARCALQEGSTNATKIVHVVQALQGHVNSSYIFQTLDQLKGTTHGAPPCVVISFHCEATMAALSQYGCKVKEWPQKGYEDAHLERLRQICKVVNLLSLFTPLSFDHNPQNLKTSPLAVSKLCCPVCWDLLDIMTRDSEGVAAQAMPHFSLLGHHSTIYPTALPPIIPENVQDQMISHFRSYLCNQLLQLRQPASDLKTHPGPSTPGWSSSSCMLKQLAAFGDDSESETIQRAITHCLSGSLLV
jgi:hypothetical protein